MARALWRGACEGTSSIIGTELPATFQMKGGIKAKSTPGLILLSGAGVMIALFHVFLVYQRYADF